MTDIDTKELRRLMDEATAGKWQPAISSVRKDETGGECPWDLSRDELDTDLLRDDAHERRRLEREYPDDE